MKHPCLHVLLCYALTLSTPSHGDSVLPFVASHSVAGSESMNLSGLDFCDGTLLTVSDKVGDTIYRLTPADGHYSIESDRKVVVPSHDYPRAWLRQVYAYLRDLIGQSDTDWEGISCSEGSVALISEMYGSILTLDGKDQPVWVSVAEERFLAKTPLYREFFIGFESISIIGKDEWVLGHERSPAKLIAVNKSRSEHQVALERALSVTDIDGYEAPQKASEDVSGSDVNNGMLYTLHRSSRQVCAQEANPLFTRFRGCRSFAAIELAERHAYPSMTYGRAEGLAVTQDRIYIVFDNNSDQRLLDGSSEALLLEFENPWGALEILCQSTNLIMRGLTYERQVRF